ncbi:VanZ family protein [Kineococcus terrestris]|uniref:VanZ family protein n=1 Tax=Kineococcus terrestris TaxID=2044856 RepID=UPI0034DAF282
MTDRTDPPRRSAPVRSAGPAGLLVLALVGAAAVTLRPVGDGWSWGAPVAEVAWYLGGLGSPATLRQLVGNVLLLAPAAAGAVLLAPRLGTARLLVPLALGAASSIELLQRVLPLGRVVSPADAVLNAAGAVLAGLVVRRAVARRRSRPASRAEDPRPAGGVRGSADRAALAGGTSSRAG